MRTEGLDLERAYQEDRILVTSNVDDFDKQAEREREQEESADERSK